MIEVFDSFIDSLNIENIKVRRLFSNDKFHVLEYKSIKHKVKERFILERDSIYTKEDIEKIVNNLLFIKII